MSINRQTLYEEGWSEPVTIVAQRFGLSDVGLAKICRKLRVPLPSRGYWAKVKAGKVMRRAPLPILDNSGQITVRLTKLDPAALEARVAAKQGERRIREAAGAVVVPPTLEDPHPLVKAAEKRLKQRDGWNNETGLRAAPAEVIDIEVTRSTLNRALLLVDTLIKELGKQAIAVRIDPQANKTFLDVEDTPIVLTVTEYVKRTAHQETPREKRARERYWHRPLGVPSEDYPVIPRFDFHPTGQLTITAGTWPSRNWRDTLKKQVERRLGEVVAGIVSLAAEIRTRQAEMARQEKERREADERYAALKERLENEKASFKELEDDAGKWERASRLRAYTDAVERHALANGGLAPDLISWLAWARAKADWLNPVIQASDPILDAPEPKRPSYW